MATTFETIKGWFDGGLTQKATHLIVVYDTFDLRNYPVYVMPGQDVHEVEQKIKENCWLRVMEVYKMSMGWNAHLNQKRVFNY
jgi:hypothetical protein